MEEIKYPIIIKIKGLHFVAYYKDSNIYYDAKGDKIGHIKDIEEVERLDKALERLGDD